MKNFLFFFFTLFVSTSIWADAAPEPTDVNLLNTNLPSQTYSNPLSAVTFTVPDGFSLNNSNDMSTMFMGPNVGGMILTIHVNVFPIPQMVDAKTMFQTNLNSYKANTMQYATAQAVDLPPALAFTTEERGKTTPGEIHRRFLMIWNNNYQTNIMFAGSYEGLGEVKGMVDQFFDGVSIIGATPPPKDEPINEAQSLSDESSNAQTESPGLMMRLVRWMLSFIGL